MKRSTSELIYTKLILKLLGVKSKKISSIRQDLPFVSGADSIFAEFAA